MDPTSVQPRSQRALAAIVLTDAVSFSARMSVDEEGTLALIRQDLQMMADLCDGHGGKVLKSTGDGLLMSFVSAVQAVSCSQAIQKQLASNAEGLPPQEYLQHRIGIHLGDVLFSDGDVLGNGVNIAARLQDKSTPGGICISQTVYDVVKARLRLRATFLGPLSLKNIQEPVPAFQIPPVGQSSTMLVEKSPVPDPSPENTPLVQAMEVLQADVQSHRIKKLVFGLCQGAWENDPVVLSQFDLLSLLTSVCQKYPTLHVLEEALESLVSRLNRKVQYLAIADAILQALRPIYTQNEQSGAHIEEHTTLSDGQVTYETIAIALHQQPNQPRIKKLLYAVIHGTWENDTAVLQQETIEDLVTKTHSVAPTAAILERRLRAIVQRLSQSSRYTNVALHIKVAFQPLYDAGAAQQTAQMPTTDPETSAAEPTLMAATPTFTEDDGPASDTCLAGEKHVSKKLMDSVSAENASASFNGTSSQPKPRNKSNLLTLRLEIMRYTNPLRAKILLLSTLHGPFGFSQQDWLTLKSKALDELVHDAFEYCSNYADLESKLTIMSHCIDNAEESTQTADVILKAMKPFYPMAESSHCPS